MHKKTTEITRLIHENFWIILSYSLAQPAAQRLLAERFQGHWKYLEKTIYEHAEVRADRALLEMATQLRVLDDAEGLSDYLKQTSHRPFGSITQSDGVITDLHFRDMTNKIMHAAGFEWNLTDDPSIICHSNDAERWKTAEIRLLSLMAFIGQLIV